LTFSFIWLHCVPCFIVNFCVLLFI